MPVEVIFPKVDMDMERGRIATWHVKPGERVSKSDPLFDIETDKAAMEVESPAEGFLHHVLAKEGSEVAIGVAVAWIYAEGEDVGDVPEGRPTPADAPPGREPDRDETQWQRPAQATSPLDAGNRRATPAARALAAQRGIDLKNIGGSGPRGRVQAKDVIANLQAPEPPLDTRSLPGWRPERGDLAVVRSGSGAHAPILMFHGLAADGPSLEALDPLLPQDREVLKMELPSHGRSPRRRVAGFADLARQVRVRFDDLALDNVHIVGHSLGGALALALADTRPRQVRSVTLISPAGLGPEFGGQILRGIIRAGSAASLGPWLRQLTSDPATITEDYVRAAMAARGDAAMRAAQADMACTLFPDDTQGFDVSGTLNRLDCPARIIWGRDDKVVPWRHALRAPGKVALHLLEGVGHLPHVERLEEVASILSDNVCRSSRSRAAN